MDFLNSLHLNLDQSSLFSTVTSAHWWHHSVHSAVAYVMPGMLAIIGVWWALRLVLCKARQRYRDMGNRSAPAQSSSSPFSIGLFRFIYRYTWREQKWLIAGAVLSLPILYASLELPKNIINYAINSGHFPISVLGTSFEQVETLFALCGAFLVTIVMHGLLKFAINLFKGKVAESLLRRMRLLVHREWRKQGRPGGNSQLIPVLIQEIEPLGGFAGDIVVTPLFQGGTFLTILLFMFAQDPILGISAIALLPIQLMVIPRLQKKINVLSRDRVKQVRELGASLGKDEPGGDKTHLSRIHNSFRILQIIRISIYRRKFLMKGISNFLNHLSPFFFYTIGGYLVIEDSLSFGALVAVLGAHKDFASPLKELFRYYQSMEDVKIRYDEVQKFLSRPPSGVSSVEVDSIENETPVQISKPQTVAPLGAINQSRTA